MSDCLTCNKSTLDGGLVVVIGTNTEVQHALCKHFWFGDEEYLQGVLCFPCWHKIQTFHRFYCEVRKLHARPLCYQAPIGLKQESHPVEFVFEVPAEQAGDSTVDDFVLEVPAEQVGDNTVVENDEIYSMKYKNPQVDVIPDPSEQPSEYIDGRHVDEKEADEPRPSKKRGKKRPRLRKNEKDAVQEYVSRNLTLNCDTCSERSETFELLQRHSMMEHAKHATMVCCSVKFSDVSRFVDHIQYHLDPDLFRCDYCFQQCISRYALNKHIRTDHITNRDSPMSASEEIELSVMRTEDVDEGPSGMLKSDASENMSTSEDEDDQDEENEHDDESESKISKHLKLTPEEKAQVQIFVKKNRKLDCDMCSERFTRFSDLQNHSIEKHNERETGLCCNRKFRDYTLFVAHILLHLNPERFKCTECPIISPSWIALLRHKQRTHSPGGREDRRKYPCHICERTFNSKQAAMQHVERHTEQTTQEDDAIDKIIAEYYKLKCDTCQKQFGSFQALHKHTTTEHRKRALVCCCKKKMRKRSELFDHYHYHQDPNRFKCKVCNKTWHHSAALGHHMKYKHHAEWKKMNSAKGSS
nr:zinc finger protein Xfin [Aedes albopictus]